MRELQTTSGLEGALDRRVRTRPGFKSGRALYLESCENYRLAREGGGSMNALLQCDAGKRGPRIHCCTGKASRRIHCYAGLKGCEYYRLRWLGRVRELQTRVGGRGLRIHCCSRSEG